MCDNYEGAPFDFAQDRSSGLKFSVTPAGTLLLFLPLPGTCVLGLLHNKYDREPWFQPSLTGLFPYINPLTQHWVRHKRRTVLGYFQTSLRDDKQRMSRRSCGDSCGKVREKPTAQKTCRGYLLACLRFLAGAFVGGMRGAVSFS